MSSVPSEALHGDAAASPSSRMAFDLSTPLRALERRFHDTTEALRHADASSTAGQPHADAAKAAVQDRITALRSATEACEAALHDTLRRLRTRVSDLNEESNLLSSHYPLLTRALSSWTGSGAHSALASARTPSLPPQHPPRPDTSPALGAAVASPRGGEDDSPAPRGNSRAVSASTNSPSTNGGIASSSTSPQPTRRGNGFANGNSAAAAATASDSVTNSPHTQCQTPNTPATLQSADRVVKGGSATPTTDGQRNGGRMAAAESVAFPHSPVSGGASVTTAALPPSAALAKDGRTLLDAAAEADSRVGELLTNGGAASAGVKQYLRQFASWRRGGERHRRDASRLHSPGGRHRSPSTSPWRSPAPQSGGRVGNRHGHGSGTHSLNSSMSLLTTSQSHATKNEGSGAGPTDTRRGSNDGGGNATVSSNGRHSPFEPANGLNGSSGKAENSTPNQETRTPANRRSVYEALFETEKTANNRPSLQATVDALLLRQLQYDGVALPPNLRDELAPATRKEEPAAHSGSCCGAEDAVAEVFREIRHRVFQPTPCPPERLVGASTTLAATSLSATGEEEADEEAAHRKPAESDARPIIALLHHTFPTTAAWLSEMIEEGALAKEKYADSLRALRTTNARNSAASEHARGKNEERTKNRPREGNEEVDGQGDIGGGASPNALMVNRGSTEFGQLAPNFNLGASGAIPHSRGGSPSRAYSALADLADFPSGEGSARLEMHGDDDDDDEEDDEDDDDDDDGGEAVLTLRHLHHVNEDEEPVSIASEEVVDEGAETSLIVAEEDEGGGDVYWDMDTTPPVYRSSPNPSYFNDTVEETDEEAASFRSNDEEGVQAEEEEEEEEMEEEEEEEADVAYSYIPHRDSGIRSQRRSREQLREEERASERALADLARYTKQRQQRKRNEPLVLAGQAAILRCQIGTRARVLLADLALLCLLQEVTFAAERSQRVPPSSRAVGALETALHLLHAAQQDPLLRQRASSAPTSGDNLLLSFQHLLTAVGYLPIVLGGGGIHSENTQCKDATAAKCTRDFVTCVAPYLTLWGTQHALTPDAASSACPQCSSGSGQGAAAASPLSPGASPFVGAAHSSPIHLGGGHSIFANPLPFPASLAPRVWQESVCSSLGQQVYRINQLVYLLRRIDQNGIPMRSVASETLGEWKSRQERVLSSDRGTQPPAQPAYPENGLSRFVFPISNVLLRELDLWNDGGLLTIPQSTRTAAENGGSSLKKGLSHRHGGEISSDSASETDEEHTAEAYFVGATEPENEVGLEHGGFALPPAEVPGRRDSGGGGGDDDDERSRGRSGVTSISAPAPQSTEAPGVQRGLWQTILPWASGFRGLDPGVTTTTSIVAEGRETRGGGERNADRASSAFSAGNIATKAHRSPAAPTESTSAVVFELPHAAVILGEQDKSLKASGQTDFARNWPTSSTPSLPDGERASSTWATLAGSRRSTHVHGGDADSRDRVHSPRKEASDRLPLRRMEQQETSATQDTLFSTDPCLITRPSTGASVSWLPAFRTTMCYCLVSRRRCLDPLVSGALLRRFTKDGEPVPAALAAAATLPGGTDEVELRRRALGRSQTPQSIPIASLGLVPATRQRTGGPGTNPTFSAALAQMLGWGEHRVAPNVFTQEVRDLHSTQRGVAQRSSEVPPLRTSTGASSDPTHRSGHHPSQSATRAADNDEERQNTLASSSLNEGDSEERQRQSAALENAENTAEAANDDFLATYVPTTRLLTPNLYDTTSSARSARLNPPDLLSCGHVVSHKELQRIISTASSRRARGLAGVPPVQSVRCPYCQAECALNSVVTLSYVY